jgi:hypothetical protein
MGGAENLLGSQKGSKSANGGEGGIRTPGTFRPNGFQDRRDRPLCHLSGGRARENPPSNGGLSSFLAGRFAEGGEIISDSGIDH